MERLNIIEIVIKKNIRATLFSLFSVIISTLIKKSINNFLILKHIFKSIITALLILYFWFLMLFLLIIIFIWNIGKNSIEEFGHAVYHIFSQLTFAKGSIVFYTLKALTLVPAIDEGFDLLVNAVSLLEKFFEVLSKFFSSFGLVLLFILIVFGL